jgi:hypothetical protein
MQKKSPQRQAGYVYMIDCKEFTKIGFSINPDERMHTMDPYNPYELYLTHTIYTRNMQRAETYLHRKLAKYRCKYEWFRLPKHISISYYKKLQTSIRILMSGDH